jgi:hypothetical protein
MAEETQNLKTSETPRKRIFAASAEDDLQEIKAIPTSDTIYESTQTINVDRKYKIAFRIGISGNHISIYCLPTTPIKKVKEELVEQLKKINQKSDQWSLDSLCLANIDRAYHLIPPNEDKTAMKQDKNNLPIESVCDSPYGFFINALPTGCFYRQESISDLFIVGGNPNIMLAFKKKTAHESPDLSAPTESMAHVT